MVVHSPYRSVLFLGPPGVGKGTQGKIIHTIPGFFHLSAGDIFRSLDPCSQLGRKIRSFTSKGEFVPDSLAIEVWHAALESSIKEFKFVPGRDILILDGMPRNVAQTELIRSTVQVIHVINLVCVDHETMVARVKRRAELEMRDDDVNEDTIRNRLEIYERQTRPVLNCYEADKISRVNADGTPAEVLQRILKPLVALQSAPSHPNLTSPTFMHRKATLQPKTN